MMLPFITNLFYVTYNKTLDTENKYICKIYLTKLNSHKIGYSVCLDKEVKDKGQNP